MYSLLHFTIMLCVYVQSKAFDYHALCLHMCTVYSMTIMLCAYMYSPLHGYYAECLWVRTVQSTAYPNGASTYLYSLNQDPAGCQYSMYSLGKYL